MSGNIPGGNFLGGNFPEGILMRGNVPGENFPVKYSIECLFSDVVNKIYMEHFFLVETTKIESILFPFKTAL